MESLIQDGRHGVRSLSSDLGFVLLSILCLGIGIGANTTVFTVVNGLLLQPLPLIEADRLVTFHETKHQDPDGLGSVSYPNFRDWQSQSAAVVEMGALRARHLTLSDGQGPERFGGALVTWNLFRLLGIEPVIGRGLLEGDDRPGAAPVVLLSEGLWRQRYAADPSTIGAHWSSTAGRTQWLASCRASLASWGVGVLLRASAEQAHNVSLPMDGRVLSFTIAIAVLTSLLFGLAPALHALRGAARDALGEGGRDVTASRPQKRLRNVLVISEVALALVVVLVASLFVRSFMNLLQAEGGLDTSGVVSLAFEMPTDRYRSTDAIVRRVEDVVARLDALPGVESVAASNLMPLRGGGARTTAVPEGEHRRDDDAATVLYGGVTSRFFEALDVPLLHGRDFTDLEGRTGSPVAIVNSRMADRLWPGQDPVGQRFRLAAFSDAEPFTVVGVSRDISNWDLSHRPLPTAYLPYWYVPVRDPRLVIRATGDPALVAAPARAAIQAVDPTLPVFTVQPLDEVHRQAFWRQELLSLLLTVFGAIAMLLAAVGVYGVLSYLVSQRTRDIGIRMALGANRRDVLRMIVREGMGLVAGGVALGLCGAFAATRLIRRQLYEVSAMDPASFGGVALLLVSVGLIASYAPASRAAAVDPMVSLRH